MQLIVGITITASEHILLNFSFPPNAPLDIVHIISQIICAAINRIMILQYINLVLSLKQRYKYVNYLLSEPLVKTDFMEAKHSNEDVSTSQNCNPIFLHTAFKLNFKNSTCIINSIHDLRLIYSQLHDTLCLVNTRYGVPIFLYTFSALTYSIPILYLEVLTLVNIVGKYVDSKGCVAAAELLGLYIPHLVFFMWLNMCCHKTSKEASETLTHVHKLLVCPNTGHRVNSELHNFCSLLRDVRIEFNICGLFDLNVHFLCWSLNVVFTYVLVLVQLNWKG